MEGVEGAASAAFLSWRLKFRVTSSRSISFKTTNVECVSRSHIDPTDNYFGKRGRKREDVPESHSSSFVGSPVPSACSTSTFSPFWMRSITSRSSPIFTSDRRMNVSKSLFSAIVWIDMDPMKRNMKIKNVAGFHSLALRAFDTALATGRVPSAPLRSGFGTSDFQNDDCATVGSELAGRLWLATVVWVVRVESVVRGALWRTATARRLRIVGTLILSS